MVTSNIKNCFCGNEATFEECCQPIINGKIMAINAEVLMRSRYTAYVIENYAYIFQTYAAYQRGKLTVKQLADNSHDTHWLSLQVLSHQTQVNTAQVEFKAFYKVDNHFYVMHELSDFVVESGKWLYSSGAIQKDSGKYLPQRNSPCVCGSTKKFKKCCAK